MQKKAIYYVGIVMLLLLSLSSCVTSRKVNYWQNPDHQIPSYNDSVPYTDYRIRKNDRLHIYVYSVDEKYSRLFNSGAGNAGYYRQNIGTMERNGGYGYGGTYELYTYLVDENGNIQFPQIGDVYVLDMTTREAKQGLEKALNTLIIGYGDQSLVTCDVQIVQRSFSIIGPTRSGRYNLTKEKLTIFEALAMAGDLGDLSSKSDIMLIREINDSTIIKTFDIRSKEILNSEFYYVEPNDVYYIRYMKGYSFGITHFTGIFGVVTSTLSFGLFVYTLEEQIRSSINKAGGKN